MELTQNIINEAENILRFEGVSSLPKQIGRTPLFLGVTDDQSILAHGVIVFEGVEYKIGTKK